MERILAQLRARSYDIRVMSAPTVVFVDNDTETLSLVSRLLHDQPFDCVMFDNGPTTLDYLRDHPVHVVVSDLRMPEMDGLDLLQQVQQQQPETIRVVLSGFGDHEVLFDAINSGLVYRYIPKPWDTVELISVVKQSLDLYALRNRQRELTAELERRNLELERRVEERTEQLLAVEKEAELGKYASQVVHGLKTPLQSIGGAVLVANLLLNESDPLQRELKHCLDTILDSAGQLHKAIVGIMAHTTDDAFMRKAVLDINEIVRREMDFFLFDEDYKLRVERHVVLDPELPQLTGNALQIKQIIDNLIKNAIDAMAGSERKVLTVRTARNDDWVQLSVTDTGCGIATENLDRVFSPFFTTKPLGKGTGIGLASVRKMVEAYGGSIGIESTVGAGTTVTVRLPAGR